MSAAIEGAPNPTLAAALAFRDRGWRPFPLDHPSLRKCPSQHKITGGVCTAAKDPSQRGKHPAGWWPTMVAARQSDQTLALWFERRGLRNIGIGCKASGLLVLDEDELGALEALAASLGKTLPSTYRVRTGRGWHFYFRAPEQELGNKAGVLKRHHIDVRGGHGDGGYVVAAGSTHHTGVVYTAENPDAELAEVPDWIVELIEAAPDAELDVSGETGHVVVPGSGRKASTASTDEPRRGFSSELRAQYRRRLGDCRTPGFRGFLFAAARDGWRLVNLGLMTEGEMLDDLATVIQRVWGAEPDLEDHTWARVEARSKAVEEPWELLDAYELPRTSTAASSGVLEVHATASRLQDPPALGEIAGGAADVGDAMVEPDEPDPASSAEMVLAGEEAAYAEALAYTVRRKRLDREAGLVLAAENREPLRVLDFDEFLDSPLPNYLVPGMLYRDGLAVVFGAPGAAKSFLVLDIALSLAAGRPWRGQGIGQGSVHYVMAEGQSTNVLRAMAWMHHHGVDRSEIRGRWATIPVPVMLTDAGVVDYVERVRSDQPDLIVLDTKNLMFVGEESKGDAYGAMLRVLHQLRVAAGGAAVVLIDHSGLADDTRVRGSNAQKGGVETEVRVVDENGARRAVVTRDKSGVAGREWLYRLEQVPDVPRPPDIPAPAVCVPLEDWDVVSDGVTWQRQREDWYVVDKQPPLPEDIALYFGRGAAAVPMLARFMRWNADGGIGFTLAAARKAVRERCVDEKGKPMFSADTVDRAWGALVDMQRLEIAEGTGGAASRSLWKAREGDPDMSATGATPAVTPGF